jgi:hypothetical protein
MTALILALTWDPTISAGNIISAVMMLGGVLVAYVSLRERLIRLETQLKPVWDEYTARGRPMRRSGDYE